MVGILGWPQFSRLGEDLSLESLLQEFTRGAAADARVRAGAEGVVIEGRWGGGTDFLLEAARLEADGSTGGTLDPERDVTRMHDLHATWRSAPPLHVYSDLAEHNPFSRRTKLLEGVHVRMSRRAAILRAPSGVMDWPAGEVSLAGPTSGSWEKGRPLGRGGSAP